MCSRYPAFYREFLTIKKRIFDDDGRYFYYIINTQAFRYACCHKGLKAYFIKMTELRDSFTLARQTGKVSKVLNTLVRPSCLIIDEVGHCTFDKENTRIFFDLVDHRYNKGGYYNMIFTSNKTPS